MKIITLHDGRKAHFPDNTDHAVIGTTIAKLMGDSEYAKQMARKRADEMANAAKHKEEESRKEDQAKRDHEERQNAAHETRHNKTIKAMGDHTKATMAVVQGVNIGLDALYKAMNKNADILQQIGVKIEKLGEKIDALTASGKRIDNLADCIDALGAQLNKSSSEFIKVMKSPRKLVHSAKGRPIGMQIDED